MSMRYPIEEDDYLLNEPNNVFPSSADPYVITPGMFDNPLIQHKNVYTNMVGYTSPANNKKTFIIPVGAHIKAMRLIREQILSTRLRTIQNNPYWIPKTPAQRDLVGLSVDQTRFPSPESDFNVGNAFTRSNPYLSGLKVKISKDSNDINSFFSQENSDLRVSAKTNCESSKNEYNVALSQDVKLNWRANTRKLQDGFLVSEPNFEILEREPRSSLKFLVKLYTSDPHTSVWMMPINEIHYSQDDPYFWVKAIMNMHRDRPFYNRLTDRYDRVKVPNISYTQTSQVNTMSGLCMPINKTNNWYQDTTTDPIYGGGQVSDSFCLKNTYEDIKFNLTSNGIGTESSVLSKLGKRIPKFWSTDGSSGGYLEAFKGNLKDNIFTIDRNVLVWIEHTYVKYPLFVGYFNKDSWNPQS